jgi:hypothetical protein
MGQSATIPHDMGATLPLEQRATDPRFRRVTRRFKLDVADAVELVAFLHIVPPAHAKWIFQWGEAGVRDARQLLAHPEISKLAQPMVEENIRALNVDVGLAVLKAMRDGGWTPGKTVPKIVRDTIAELRSLGNSGAKISRVTGIPEPTISRWLHGPSKRSESRRSRAVAALVL